VAGGCIIDRHVFADRSVEIATLELKDKIMVFGIFNANVCISADDGLAMAQRALVVVGHLKDDRRSHTSVRG